VILSKATSYGIRALAYMASLPEQRLLGLQEIAAHEDIPPAYLRKILGELRRHRLLRSVKGIHGGYELGRSPKEITLWEVFKVLEPDPYMDTCILGNKICTPESACAFHDDWQKLRTELMALLETRTISEAASEIKRPRELRNSPQVAADAAENRGRLDEEEHVPNPT
jgi:Rrf2 family protein